LSCRRGERAGRAGSDGSRTQLVANSDSNRNRPRLPSEPGAKPPASSPARAPTYTVARRYVPWCDGGCPPPGCGGEDCSSSLWPVFRFHRPVAARAPLENGSARIPLISGRSQSPERKDAVIRCRTMPTEPERPRACRRGLRFYRIQGRPVPIRTWPPVLNVSQRR